MYSFSKGDNLPRFMTILIGIILFAGLAAAPLSAQNVTYTIESVIQANFPVALAFAPDGRLFYTEKHNGAIRVVSPDGVLQDEPVLQLPTSGLLERGMIGIAFDPDYETNQYMWVFHTARGSDTTYPANNVVRFREVDGLGIEPMVMLSVPVTNDSAIHNGGNLRFDEQGFLIVSLGDYNDPANAQNLDVPQGKLLRFEVSGDELLPAPDNPFPDNSTYAYGLRNPFDFAFDPISGQVFLTENGPECDDEINRVVPGKNYGWRPDYQCVGTDMLDLEDYVPPLLSFNPSQAPTGITFYNHEAIPEWNGDLFYCTFLGGVLHRVVLNEARDAIVQVEDLDMQGSDCRIDVEVGPDGAIYFTSPNEIFRLRPAGE
jgi:glucose/arabinose dehydrogenase